MGPGIPGPFPSRTHMKTETETVRSFFGNEAFVLITIAAEPQTTMRAVAEKTGMTERNVQRIVALLVREDYLTVTRVGRQNEYVLNLDRDLPHPMETGKTVGDVIRFFRPKKEK